MVTPDTAALAKEKDYRTDSLRPPRSNLPRRTALVLLLLVLSALFMPAATAYADDDDSDVNKACQAVVSAPIDLIPGVGDVTGGIKDLACTAGTEGTDAAMPCVSG